MASYIGAIDQGTTSSRFIVFDRSGRIVSSAQKEHEQIYPKPGWVEHDPEEIWRRTDGVIQEAMEARGLRPEDLAAIGITNQRETTVVWHRKSGKPVYNAIVWQDTRVAPAVTEFGSVRRTGPLSRADRPSARYLFQWSQDSVDSRRGCGRTRTSGSRRSAVRQYRYFSDLAPHRWNAWRRPPDGCDQCQPHPTDEPQHARVGSGHSGGFWHPDPDAAEDCFKQRSLRHGATAGG